MFRFMQSVLRLFKPLLFPIKLDRIRLPPGVFFFLISLTELFNQFFVVLAACFLVNFGKVIFQRAFDNIQFFCNLAAAFSFYQFFENCLLLACQAVKNTFICKKRGYKSLLYVSVAGKTSSFIIRKM